MMLYEKSRFGRKYTRLVTSSPILYSAFVLFGIMLFLLLTLTTKIDDISTYPAVVRALEGDVTLSTKADKGVNILEGTAYIYLDKNEAVYPVSIERVELSEGKSTLYFNLNEQKIIRSLQADNLSIDIPQGKETMLYRIFAKGGG